MNWNLDKLFLGAFISITLVGCSLSSSQQRSSGQEVEIEPGRAITAGLPARIQVLPYLAALTNSPEYITSNPIRNQYNTSLGAMSAQGDTADFIPAFSLAMNDLNALFCGLAITREVALEQTDAASKVIYKGIRLNATLNVATDSEVAALIHGLSQRCFGRQADAEEFAAIREAFEGMRQSLPATGVNSQATTAGTRLISQATCALVIGSIGCITQAAE